MTDQIETTDLYFDDDDTPYPLRLASWPKGSVWRFKRQLNQEDAEQAARLTSVSHFEIDAEERDKALARGEDYIPRALTVEEEISAVRAMLVTQSLGWEGPRFTFNPKKRNPDGSSHPLAGQVMPCTLEWIGKLKPTEVDQIRKKLNRLYAGVSADAEEAFPDGDLGGDQPADEPDVAGAVPAADVPAGVELD